MKFLNTRLGAMAAAAATHGTAVDVVQRQHRDPDCPCVEPLSPMGMAAPCFDNSTRSACNTADPDCPYLGATATHGYGRPLLRK